MKMIEQLLAQSRASVRRARARLPGTPPPGRLVLRLNDHGVPDGRPRIEGEPMNLKRWRELLAGFHHWLGPLRVTIAGGAPGRAALLVDLVRFANRLECPTHVVSGIEGLDDDRVDALIGCGVAAITIALDDPEAGMERLAAFSAARADWGRPVSLFGAVDPGGPPRQLVALADQARRLALDGLVGRVPLGAPRPAGWSEGLLALADMDRTPAARRRGRAGRPAPLPGGARAEILADGALTISPLMPPAARLDSVTAGELQAAWEGAAGPALREARSLERPWDEVELSPAMLFSRR